MIIQKVIEEAMKLSYDNSKKYTTPPVFHIDLSFNKGQELAELLKADKNVVDVGTLLMDCMLGVALREGKLAEHVVMGVEKTKKFLSQFSEVSNEEKQNIISCVEQHHGASHFFSIESEICCNADCYRFASIKGFLGTVRYGRDMELAELVSSLSEKADEKWNALSLDICKRELESQYRLIKDFLGSYKK